MSLHVWRIRDDLFIRGQFSKRPARISELNELGVTSVITMLRTTDPALQEESLAGRIEYRSFPLPDTSVVKESALWHAALHAQREIESGKNVLIHCISARDRSPAAAALTLCCLEGISGNEAMLRVKQKKPTTFRNQAFVRYLSNIEEKHTT